MRRCECEDCGRNVPVERVVFLSKDTGIPEVREVFLAHMKIPYGRGLYDLCAGTGQLVAVKAVVS